MPGSAGISVPPRCSCAITGWDSLEITIEQFVQLLRGHSFYPFFEPAVIPTIIWLPAFWSFTGILSQKLGKFGLVYKFPASSSLGIVGHAMKTQVGRKGSVESSWGTSPITRPPE